ncbi:unnamed protein product [Didymodactylos carnosus]|uniref:Phospholipid/glycerol acyltransferase domain-containing protein n=1 Tax=Didymodactylos carnosus TaxID=1234261 RepID=A0A813WHZ7_9BILA|nr:unnamed protein product [Didymodactylos carnosus]CAF1456487.1 unnamed protein product [Didymodactylos carnosus]CAF3649293.1 unnamed protein product [Didymodactylos carnosus]CAF4250489.1 unnamed protein product [Didymodactylos carnosus]
MTVVDLFKKCQTFFLVQGLLGYVFIISGLIVNFLQLCSLVVWPFSRQLYRKINCRLATLIWSQLTFLNQWWSYSDCVLYIDPKDLEYLKHEHSICLTNHKYPIDWLLGWVIAQRIGLLGGSKIVGKKSLSQLPIVGWTWMFTESIFLKRVWETDKNILYEDVQRILGDYPKDYYFNFLMTCEGTRFTEKKRVESMKVAKEKGLPELKHHILPRTKGFTLIMQGAKGKISGVYNFTLAFTPDSAPPLLTTLIKGQACKAECYIKRIPVTEIPYEDEKKCAEWLHKLFQEKDQIYDYFDKHKTFEGLDLPKVYVPRNYNDLIIELFWTIVIGIPSIFLLIRFLWTSSLTAQIIFLVIVIASIMGVRRMIDVATIKKEQ